MADLSNQTEEVFQGGTTDQWRDYVDTLKVDIAEVPFKDAATFVAEATPIIGDAIAAKEVYDELKKENPNYLLVGALGGAALIGLIPGLGDAAAAGIRKGAKSALDTVKRVEVDPDAVGMMGGNVRIKPKSAANQPNIISFTEKKEAKELQDTFNTLNTKMQDSAKKLGEIVQKAKTEGIFGEYEIGATVKGRNKNGPLPFKIEGHTLDEVKLESDRFKRLQDRVDGGLTIIEKDGKKYKQFYGMSSELAMKKHYGKMAKYRSSEGREIKVKYKGALDTTVLDYLGGIRSTCAYINAHKIKHMSKCVTFVVVSQQINTHLVK